MIADPRFARWYQNLPPDTKATVTAMLGYLSASLSGEVDPTPGRSDRRQPTLPKDVGTAAEPSAPANDRSCSASSLPSTPTTSQWSSWAATKPATGLNGTTWQYRPPTTITTTSFADTNDRRRRRNQSRAVARLGRRSSGGYGRPNLPRPRRKSATTKRNGPENIKPPCHRFAGHYKSPKPKWRPD